VLYCRVAIQLCGQPLLSVMLIAFANYCGMGQTLTWKLAGAQPCLQPAHRVTLIHCCSCWRRGPQSIMRLLQVRLHTKALTSLLPPQRLVSTVCRDAGTTALSAAIKQRRSAAVQILLSRGADLDRANAHGVTPLAVAQVQGALKASILPKAN